MPVKRGGANAAGLPFPGQFRRLNLSPHPSREGRGLFPSCSVWLRAKWVARGEGGGSGMGEGRTKLNRDGVDVRLKLRSPS